MRIGLPDSVLFNRYGTWWTTFLEGIGMDVVLPKASFADALKVGQNAMPDEPVTMQLLIGRVFELSTEVEALLIPDINPGAEPGTRGAALEPWLVDLPTMLATRFSLPTIYKVPARLETSETTSAAVRLGQTLTGNAQVVRRSLDKIQASLKPSQTPEPMWQHAGRTTIGLVADPILLEQPFLIADTLAAFEQAALHPVFITSMPRARALEEGKRINPNLLEIDHEMIGSATLLASKAAIRGLVYITQANTPAHHKLLERSAANTKKPTLILEWNNFDLMALNEFVEKISL
jgi:hypothetical protein